MGTLLSKFGEGRGGGVSLRVGGGRELSLFLSLSLPTYLAALKGVVEAARERIHGLHYHHHHHHGV